MVDLIASFNPRLVAVLFSLWTRDDVLPHKAFILVFSVIQTVNFVLSYRFQYGQYDGGAVTSGKAVIMICQMDELLDILYTYRRYQV